MLAPPRTALTPHRAAGAPLAARVTRPGSLLLWPRRAAVPATSSSSGGGGADPAATPATAAAPTEPDGLLPEEDFVVGWRSLTWG
jgi:hypothetical protein